MENNLNLTTNFIHKAFGIPLQEKSNFYQTFRFAKKAKRNDVAFLYFKGMNMEEAYLHEQLLADMAIERGATLLVSTSQIKDYPCLVVDNVFESWIKLSSAWRKKFNLKTVGITGSIGKTTTKNFIAAAIGYNDSVKASAQSFNVWPVVGKTIRNLKDHYKFYIQEVSEGPTKDNPKIISKIINPAIAVITKISESHMETFGAIENVIDSCFSITEGMEEDGTLLINADDPYQLNYKSKVKIATYGILNTNSHYHAINIKPVYHIERLGIDFDIKYRGEVIPIHINLFGEHNVYCALAAFATAKILGLDDEVIQKNIIEVKPEGIRQNLIKIGDYSLYLDCYNANYESMSSSIKILSLLEKDETNFKRIAVLSDIAEAGEDAKLMHQNVGKTVLDSNIDVLICFGEQAKNITTVVKDRSSIEVFHTLDIIEASEFLFQVAQPHDIILFKGSRAGTLELVVDKVFGTNFYENGKKIEKEIVKKKDYKISVFPVAKNSRIDKYKGKDKDIILRNSIENYPIETIGMQAFSRNGLEKITFPATVLRINERAFCNCINLRRVNLSKNLRIIGKDAFSGCTKLKKVIIKNQTIKIGSKAFYNCKKLKELEIPTSVSFISEDAFEGCSNLTIISEKNSYAQKYAIFHNIKFLATHQYKWLIFKRKIKRNFRRSWLQINLE